MQSTELPSYLIVASSATQMYSGVGRVIFDWMCFAAPHFRLCMLMDMEDAENFRIVARFCREHEIPFLVSRTARRPGAPDTGMGGAARVLGSADWDFVEVVSWASAATALDVLAAKPKTARLVFTPHTQPLETLPNPETHFLVEPVFDAVMQAADLVFCTSPVERSQLESRYPHRKCFRDTPNGVDATVFCRDGSISDGTVLSVFDAREHRKRPDLLWAAFSEAADHDARLRLVVAGRFTQNLIVPDRLRSRVTTLGYVSQDALLRLYRAARCLVLLSDFEAFGLPIAEALMCGTPVIATRGAQQESLFVGLPGIELVDNHEPVAAGLAIRQAGEGVDSAQIEAAARKRFGLEATYGLKLSALRAMPPRVVSALIQGDALQQPAAFTGPGRHTGFADAAAVTSRKLRVVQVTPGYFAEASMLGGGERYVENVCRALRVAAAGNRKIACSVISFGPVSSRLQSTSGTTYDIVAGLADAPESIDAAALDRLLAGADIVHVHQCFSEAGMFVASRARLLGRRVLGSDHGGGEMAALHTHPRLAGLYDAAVVFSRFGETAFLDFAVPIHRLSGPVDDAYFTVSGANIRDPHLLIAVGRILPHKGLHHVVEALPQGLSLVIAGRPYDPAYRSSLAKQARGKDVTFEDALDDAGLLRLMQAAGLGVHFSSHTGPGGTFYYKPELLGLAPLECLCTGLPMLTSAAGALRELGELPGCRVVETVTELRQALERWKSGADLVPPDAVIRRGAVAHYGLRQFGAAYLDLLQAHR